MDDLIEALTILRKYGNPYSPTYCQNDMMTFCVGAEDVSTQDVLRLEELGVMVDDDEDCFYSTRFGSA